MEIKIYIKIFFYYIMEDDSRSFTVVEISTSKNKKSKENEGGRFIAKTPRAAASKAFSQTCRNSKIKGVCTLVVHMKETTQGADGKTFSYKLKRTKLSKPEVVNGITYRYKNTLSSMNIKKKPEKKVSKKVSSKKKVSKKKPVKKVSKKKVSKKKSSKPKGDFLQIEMLQG